MTPFDALYTLLLHDLRELHQIQQRRWLVLPMTRVVKEQHLGQYCYLAEEFLSPADLRALKHEVGLDEQRWHTYKWIFLHTAPAFW